MTRIAFVADVHIANHRRFGGDAKSGLNARARMVIDTLDRAGAEAVRLDCSALVVLGDLFDTTRPSPQEIYAAQVVLQRFRGTRSSGFRDIYLLMGNHDMVSTDDDDNALVPLHTIAGVIESPAIFLHGNVEMVMVPYRPGPARAWLEPEVRRLMGVEYRQKMGLPASGDNLRVLCLHLGLADDRTPPWLQGAHDSVDVADVARMCKELDIHTVVAGNWHEARTWKRLRIHQVGALVPTGFDDAGLNYGRMIVFDSEKGTCSAAMIPGPRFCTARTDDDLALLLRSARDLAGCQVYLRRIADATIFDRARDEVAQLVADGVFAAGCVEPDESDMRDRAEDAAVQARKSETLDEALSAFVDGMNLPNGITPEDVVSKARQYLGAVTPEG